MGELCEYELNECSSNPCAKGSLCVDKINGYVCICDPLMQGVRCKEVVPFCKRFNEPCKNGADCYSCNSDTFKVICSPIMLIFSVLSHKQQIDIHVYAMDVKTCVCVFVCLRVLLWVRDVYRPGTENDPVESYDNVGSRVRPPAHIPHFPLSLGLKISTIPLCTSTTFSSR